MRARAAGPGHRRQRRRRRHRGERTHRDRIGALPVDTSAPTIYGAALRGTALSSTEGGWSGIGNAYAYQWQRSADGATWTNIPGATGTSYTLAVADEGDECGCW